MDYMLYKKLFLEDKSPQYGRFPPQMGSTTDTESDSDHKLVVEPMVLLDENNKDMSLSSDDSVMIKTEPISLNSSARRKSVPERTLQQCPICKKYFKRIEHHMMSHRTPETIGTGFTCDFCTKVFNTLGNLKVHLRTHTGHKPYVCEICSKGFTQSCNLMNHMRTHTKERPFKCPQCAKAFSQSGNLSNHIRLHSQEKPFKCHVCDKAFTQSSNLNSHLKNNHKFTHFIA